MGKRLKALQGRIVYIKLDSGAEVKAEVELYNSSSMMDTDFDSIDAKVLDVIQDQEAAYKLASLVNSNSLINITDNEITDIEIIGISQGLWRKNLKKQFFIIKSYLAEGGTDVALEGILHIDNERMKPHNMNIVLPLNNSFDLTMKIKSIDCIGKEGQTKLTVECDDGKEAEFILALGLENEIVELTI